MTVDLMEPSAATRAGLDAQLHTHAAQLAGYLWITPPAQPGQRPLFAYHARSAGDISTEDAIEHGVNAVLTREGLLSHGLTSAQIDEITAPVEIDTSSQRQQRTSPSASPISSSSSCTWSSCSTA